MQNLFKTINKTTKFILNNKNWLFALFCTAVFALIAEDVWEKERILFDGFIYNSIQNIINPANTVVFKIITNLANTEIFIFLCIILVAFIKRTRHGFLVVLNLVNITILNQALKTIFARPRPNNIYMVSVSGYSFPSGHAMTSVAFYGFIIYLVWQTNIRKKLKIAVSAFLSILIILIGLSRIYLGVHYASDVIAGISISIAYLIVFTKFVSNYLKGNKKMIPNESKKNRNSLISSFKCAFMGIIQSLKSGGNIIIHITIMILVILFGIFLKINLIEWIACIILFGMVIAAEIINTAIETIVNLVTGEFNPLAKRAKDMAAGAVLVLAVSSAIVGLIIFVPKIFNLIF